MTSPKFENFRQTGQMHHCSSAIVNMQPFEQEDRSLAHS